MSKRGASADAASTMHPKKRMRADAAKAEDICEVRHSPSSLVEGGGEVWGYWNRGLCDLVSTLELEPCRERLDTCGYRNGQGSRVYWCIPVSTCA